jgi:two-component system, chemotaxis family, chemotaxis protein CheY
MLVAGEQGRQSAGMQQPAEKLLALDDSTLVTDLIKFALRKFPIDIISATRAESALKALEESPVSIIITDLKMPGINGLDFLARVRGMEAYRETPLLVVSGYQEKSHVEAALAAGATAFIPKPFTSNEILDFVMRELQREKPQ